MIQNQIPSQITQQMIQMRQQMIKKLVQQKKMPLNYLKKKTESNGWPSNKGKKVTYGERDQLIKSQLKLW
jgi:hypothetical protein